MEHALIVSIPLSDGGFGSDDERDVLFALEDQMEAAIESAAAGEFDGDEFGQGECVLYMYGPDADRLFSVVEPLLKSCPNTAGGHAIKRYGDAADPDAKEVRVEL